MPRNPPCTPISLFVKPTSPSDISSPIIPLTFTHLSPFSLQTNFNCAILCRSLPYDPPPSEFSHSFYSSHSPYRPLVYINPPLQTFWLPSWDPPPTSLPVIPLKLHVSISLSSHILKLDSCCMGLVGGSQSLGQHHHLSAPHGQWREAAVSSKHPQIMYFYINN